MARALPPAPPHGTRRNAVSKGPCLGATAPAQRLRVEARAAWTWPSLSRGGIPPVAAGTVEPSGDSRLPGSSGPGHRRRRVPPHAVLPGGDGRGGAASSRYSRRRRPPETAAPDPRCGAWTHHRPDDRAHPGPWMAAWPYQWDDRIAAVDLVRPSDVCREQRPGSPAEDLGRDAAGRLDRGIPRPCHRPAPPEPAPVLAREPRAARSVVLELPHERGITGG